MLTAFAPLSTDMYLAAIPTVARDLATTLAAAQETLAAFFVGMAIGQLIYGPLSDRYGRRRPLLAGCALYTLASALCAIAPSIHLLIFARLLTALGGSAGIVVVRAVVRDLYAVDDSARVYSRLMLVMGAAPILAPVIGSGILYVAGWRAIFWALAAFGIAALLAVYRTLPETHAGTPGAAHPLQALRTFGAVLRDPRFLAPAGAAALAYSALFAFLTGSPGVLIKDFGLSPTAYGAAFGVIAFGYIGCAQINARHVGRSGARILLYRGLSALVIVAIAQLACAASGAAGAWLAIALWLAQLCAMGFVVGNSAALALADQAPRAGSAAAVLGALQFTSGGLAGSAVGVLAPRVGSTLIAMAVVVLAGCLAAWLVAPWKARAAPKLTAAL